MCVVCACTAHACCIQERPGRAWGWGFKRGRRGECTAHTSAKVGRIAGAQCITGGEGECTAHTSAEVGKNSWDAVYD